MTTIRTLHCAAAFLLACACAAPRDDRPPELPLPELDCACGALEADVFGCPAPACSAERGDPKNPRCACAPLERGSIRLVDGTLLTGEIVADDGTTLEVRTPDGETRSLAITELDTLAAYRVACARIGQADALGQLELAALASELGLFARARHHQALAEAASPAAAPRVAAARAALEAARAAHILLAAEEAQAAGRQREAERLLAAVITTHPNSAEALAAADALALAANEERDARATWRAAWTSEQALALAPAALELEQVHGYAHRGLMSGASPLRAVAYFEAALRHGAEAATRLDTVLEQATAHGSRALAARELQVELQELRVATCVSLAEVAAGIGAYETARLAALRARDLAPESEPARRLHARVALAASEASWPH